MYFEKKKVGKSVKHKAEYEAVGYENSDEESEYVDDE